MQNKFIKIGSWIIVGLFILQCKSVFTHIKPVQGSGRLVTLDENFSDFDRIDIGHTFNVEITHADHYSVTLRIDDNLEEYLDVFQSEQTLELGLKGEFRYKDITLTAQITLPDLQQLQLSGATSARLNDFKLQHDVAISCSGTGKVTGTLNSEDLNVELSGASRLALSGRGKNLILEVSGASTADLGDFLGHDAEVEISGASQATVNLTGTFDGEVSGASTLYYSGAAEPGHIETSGASSIVKKYE